MEKWYTTAFGADYLEIYHHRDRAEARQAVECVKRSLNLTSGDLILDLCCGAGRHTLELVSQGYRTIGLDLSYPLLQRAAEYAQNENSTLQLVRADMAHIPFKKDSFTVVINLFNSFGYYMGDEHNYQALEEIYEVLRPGGRFFIDYFNRDYIVANLVAESEKILNNGMVLVESREIGQSGKRVNKRSRIIKDGKETVRYESVRLFSPEELTDMLHTAGFTINAKFGDFARGAWTPESPHLIIAANK